MAAGPEVRAQMVSKLAKYRALSGPDRHTLLVAIALLPVWRIAISVLGLARLQARLTKTPVAPGPRPDDGQVAHLAKLVSTAAQHTIAPANCLTRSLLLLWMLRRRGVDAQLRIGVRLADGQLDAHAWVEDKGVPVNDPPEVTRRFAAFHDPVSIRSFTGP